MVFRLEQRSRLITAVEGRGGGRYVAINTACVIARAHVGMRLAAAPTCTPIGGLVVDLDEPALTAHRRSEMRTNLLLTGSPSAVFADRPVRIAELGGDDAGPVTLAPTMTAITVTNRC